MTMERTPRTRSAGLRMRAAGAVLLGVLGGWPALRGQEPPERPKPLPFQTVVPLSPREGREWEPPARPVPLDSAWQKESRYMSPGSFGRLREATRMVRDYEGQIHLSGLAFDVVIPDHGWPSLRLPCAVGVGRHPETARTMEADSREIEAWARDPKLGAVRIPGAGDAVPDEQAVDWAHTTLLFEPDAGPALAVTVSRLTPAILIETEAARVELFASKRLPRHIALPAEDGVTVLDLLSPAAPADDAVAAMREDWMLLWWGATSPFLAHPYPLSYWMRRRWNSEWTGILAEEFPPADCPVLLVFEAAPGRVSAGDGVILEFGSDLNEARAGRIVVLPLFGLRHPSRDATAQWSEGLPEEVERACRWWARHLSRFPLTVEESYAFDPAAERATVTERFEFAPLRDGGDWLAPIPPMLALAHRYGLGVEFSAEPAGEGCVTAVGPAAGIPNVESYTWSIRDLARYATERRALAQVPREAPAELQERLEEEIRKILDAGHLAPWLALVCDLHPNGCYHFLRTGDTLRYLAPVLDLLPPDLAAATVEYLEAERALCPPARCLNLPVFEGARREYWLADEKVFAGYNPANRWLAGVGYWYWPPIPIPMNDRVPVRDLYGLWAGLEAAGERLDDAGWADCRAALMATAAGHEWASLGWFHRAAEISATDGETPHRHYIQRYYGGVMAANSYFGGLVGFIRLARMRGDAGAEAFGWGLFSRTAALSFALRKFTAHLYDNGALRVPPWAEKEPDWMPRRFSVISGYLWASEWTKPEHDVRQVVCLDERGVCLLEQNQHHMQAHLVAMMHPTPELGRFLSDHCRRELDAHHQRVRECFPDWHLARAETHLGGDKSHYREPTDPYQIFMERAWVAQETPEQLAARLDIPWEARGDLFYLERLAETIRAFRGAEWRRIEPADPGRREPRGK